MRIKNARFVVSQSDYKACKDYGIPEFAIAGKSNVGKSSFINMIANINRLAKTSSTPGRTRLLNYFEFNGGEFIFVDLPGYGYAKMPASEKKDWDKLIGGYFQTSKQLLMTFVLLDIRHEPSALDKQMIAYLHHYNIPFTIIATKSDKLSRAGINKQKQILANCLALTPAHIIAVSALKKTGIEEVLQKIEDVMLEERQSEQDKLEELIEE